MGFAKLSSHAKDKWRNAVLLLRFRTPEPTQASPTYASYRSIAQATGLAYNSVQHICRRAVRGTKMEPRVRFPLHRLEREHIDFLTSEHTLEKQAGMSLKERCDAFELLFPPKKLCPTTLRRIYSRSHITRKSVKELKPLDRHKAHAYHEQKEKLLSDMENAEQERRKIIYLDEITFTKRALLTKTYSHRYTNIAVNQDRVYTDYLSAIAAVSEEKGVEYIQIKGTAID